MTTVHNCMDLHYSCVIVSTLVFAAQSETGENDLFFRAKYFFRDQFLVSQNELCAFH